MLNDSMNPRDVKMMLSFEITKLYCGKDAADLAEKRFKLVFQQNAMPDDVPVIEIENQSDVLIGELILNALVEHSYYKSKSEARRIFSQGGAQLDGKKVLDVKEIFVENGEAVLKMGKSKYFKIKQK